ncbi:glutamate racemase [Pseudomonas sp. SMV71]|uniref:glutamate racemase n=1 Tax=Pseudomonas sp. SMV71 TaxID=3390195 RepID=UPI003F87D1E6
MSAQKPPITAMKLWLGDETMFDGLQLSTIHPIIIVDSGIGGLTVARQLEQLNPKTHILYVADNEWFPYGNKSRLVVAQRIQLLIDSLCTWVKPSAIVVACNTASVAIIENNLDKIWINFLLTTPPIVDAADISESKNIVLLATPGTVKSRYVIQKIAETNGRARIWSIATQSLVKLSEARLAGEDVSLASFAKLIANYLTEEQRLSVDTLILGCTHFPHLIDDLRNIFPNVHNWVDPAKKTAIQAASLIKISDSSYRTPLRMAIFTSKQNVTKYHQIFAKCGFSLKQPTVKNKTPTETAS